MNGHIQELPDSPGPAGPAGAPAACDTRAAVSPSRGSGAPSPPPRTFPPAAAPPHLSRASSATCPLYVAAVTGCPCNTLHLQVTSESFHCNPQRKHPACDYLVCGRLHARGCSRCSAAAGLHGVVHQRARLPGRPGPWCARVLPRLQALQPCLPNSAQCVSISILCSGHDIYSAQVRAKANTPPNAPKWQRQNTCIDPARG